MRAGETFGPEGLMHFHLSLDDGGSAGIDGQTFDDIESYGVVGWLAELKEKLRTGEYRPQPIRRVWIPKRNGKLRPLGISRIRHRVVQMAMNLVLLPIFESDFCASQYAYRPKLDAKGGSTTCLFPRH